MKSNSRFITLKNSATMLVATLLLGTATVTQATPVELVVNGEFELPGALGSGLNFVDNALMPGWTCSQGSCEIWGQDFDTAPNFGSDGLLTGNHHELTLHPGPQGTTFESILVGASQVLADFSFDMWPRAGSGVSWLVSGTVSGVLSAGTVTGQNSIWTNTTVTGLVLTPGESVTLSFTSFASSGVGEHIDGVSLLATPEPSTALLLGLGLTGLAAQRRRSLRS